MYERFPLGLALGRGLAEVDELSDSVMPYAIGAQDQSPGDPGLSLHPEHDAVKEQVLVGVHQEPGVVPLDLGVQAPADAGDRLGAYTLTQ